MIFQGTQLRGGDNPILDIRPPAGATRREERRNLDLLARLNRSHASRLPGHPDLEARIAAYELAFRMQSEVPEAVDLARETESTRRLYGLDQDACRAFGERCLLARRLVERGVRFVQGRKGHRPPERARGGDRSGRSPGAEEDSTRPS